MGMSSLSNELPVWLLAGRTICCVTFPSLSHKGIKNQKQIHKKRRTVICNVVFLLMMMSDLVHVVLEEND